MVGTKPREGEVFDPDTVREDDWPHFLSGLTHELNTPLASLGVVVELLGREGIGLSDNQQRYTENLHQLVREMQELLHDVGTFARLRGGRVRKRVEALSPEDVMRRATDAIRTSAWEMGITVSTELQPGLPMIHTDAALLEQALDALLETALFLADREVSVQAESRGSFLFFTFRGDAGCGPSEDPESLFNPFEGGTARKLKQKGARPLAPLLAREIATELGGELKMVAEEGRSKCVLRLPLPGPSP
ncbi:MAG: HAMP domain-containing sensor histidine kinase [Acidobacteriota bacterium]|nr:HAMP domain-containing sensor histidine kinase [Acidobacteriota bacterium]